MKRTLKIALCAVIGTMIIAPAMAQDNFPDVPDNHWAYEALENLKREGILVGYPDGLYRGGRPASRYEMAVAIHAAFMRLKALDDGLDEQIKMLSKKVDDMDAELKAADLKGLRDDLAALKTTVAGMQSWKDDIDALKRMADEFKKELAAMGVDVEQMKKDLADHEARIKALEARKPAVEISGDVNALLLAGNSTDKRFGLTMGRRLTGVGKGGYAGQPVGMTRDLNVFHEAAFTFKGTNDEGPKWRATLVAGNILSPGGASDKAWGAVGGAFSDTSSSDVYMDELSVNFDTAVAGLKFNAEVGRIGHQVNNFLYQRPDFTDWYSNDRWDNGNWTFDGGILTFNFGAAELKAFGGRTSSRRSVNGAELNAVMVGNANDNQKAQIDQNLGLSLSFPISSMGKINLAYIWNDLNTPTTAGGLTTRAFNRVAVYGGDIELNFGDVKLTGKYGRSDYQYNTSNVLNKDNSAFEGALAYKGGNFGLEAAYRRIERNYGAPGSWGNMGVIWNPTDIQGLMVKGHLDVSNAFKIWAAGQFYEGISAARQDDKYTTGTFGLNFNVSDNWSLMAQYDTVNFNKNVGVDPTENWFTFGANYKLGSKTNLLVRYQISDLKNTLSLPYNITGLTANRYTGGLLSTQLSIKF